jgi:hypothetical protein
MTYVPESPRPETARPDLLSCLSVLYRLRTGPIAAALLGVYGVIGLVLAVVYGRFGSGG